MGNEAELVSDNILDFLKGMGNVFGMLVCKNIKVIIKRKDNDEVIHCENFDDMQKANRFVRDFLFEKTIKDILNYDVKFDGSTE